MSSDSQPQSVPRVEPEVITDLSELLFEFEDSGPSEYRAVPQGRSNEDERDNAVLKDDQQLLNELAVQLTGDGLPEFYCQPLGHFLGPMSLEDLRGMAESGALAENDPVRFGEDGEWKLAKEFPRLVGSLRCGSTIAAEPVSSVPPSTRRLFQTGFKPSADSSAGDRPATAAADVPPASISAEVLKNVSDPEGAIVVNDSLPQPAAPRRRVARKAERGSVEGSRRKVSKQRTALRASQRKPQDEAEEAVLKEIFEEVFALDDKTSRPSMPPSSSDSGRPSVHGDSSSVPQP